jgi:uncharacterized ion transporter superfamily protein YfcC
VSRFDLLLQTLTASSDKGSQVIVILIAIIGGLLGIIIVTSAVMLLVRVLRKNRSGSGSRSSSKR